VFGALKVALERIATEVFPLLVGLTLGGSSPGLMSIVIDSSVIVVAVIETGLPTVGGREGSLPKTSMVGRVELRSTPKK